MLFFTEENFSIVPSCFDGKAHQVMEFPWVLTGISSIDWVSVARARSDWLSEWMFDAWNCHEQLMRYETSTFCGSSEGSSADFSQKSTPSARVGFHSSVKWRFLACSSCFPKHRLKWLLTLTSLKSTWFKLTKDMPNMIFSFLENIYMVVLVYRWSEDPCDISCVRAWVGRPKSVIPIAPGKGL